MGDGADAEDGAFLAVGVEKQDGRGLVADSGQERGEQGAADATGLAGEDEVQADVPGVREQVGEARILRDGEDPATTAVETAKEFTYMVNEDAAERQGVTIPETILSEAETV